MLILNYTILTSQSIKKTQNGEMLPSAINLQFPIHSKEIFDSHFALPLILHLKIEFQGRVTILSKGGNQITKHLGSCKPFRKGFENSLILISWTPDFDTLRFIILFSFWTFFLNNN